MHILQISALLCAFISLLFLLIALGSNYWLQNGNINSGLWMGCGPSSLGGSYYICGSYPIDAVADAIHVTRAFLFFGMFAGAISCFGLVCTFFSFQLGSIAKTKSSAVASLVAAVFVLIAMATFTGTVGTNAPYGWSFGLGWASFPLFLITGGLAFALGTGVSA